jgi:hypothetical protein
MIHLEQSKSEEKLTFFVHQNKTLLLVHLKYAGKLKIQQTWRKKIYRHEYDKDILFRIYK